MITGWLITKKFETNAPNIPAVVPEYAYLIDEGVFMQEFVAQIAAKHSTLKLYVCNYSCQKHNIQNSEHYVPSGLFMLSQLLERTDNLIQDEEIYSYTH